MPHAPRGAERAGPRPKSESCGQSAIASLDLRGLDATSIPRWRKTEAVVIGESVSHAGPPLSSAYRVRTRNEAPSGMTRVACRQRDGRNRRTSRDAMGLRVIPPPPMSDDDFRMNASGGRAPRSQHARATSGSSTVSCAGSEGLELEVAYQPPLPCEGALDGADEDAGCAAAGCAAAP